MISAPTKIPRVTEFPRERENTVKSRAISKKMNGKIDQSDALKGKRKIHIISAEVGLQTISNYKTTPGKNITRGYFY